MAETQLASMRIGSVDLGEETKRKESTPIIHVIDGQTDAILDWITVGNVISNNHRKSLKDTLETFDFETFADKRFSEHLTDLNRVVIPDEDGTYVEFVIQQAGKFRNNEGLKMEVYTSASYLMLKKAKVIRPHSTASETARQHAELALENTEWQVGEVVHTGYRTFHFDDYSDPYRYLKRIASEFDLELNFRVEIDSNRITGRYVDIVERVGMWRGREVEFGKDLAGIRRVERTDEVVTALIGVGPEREDGTRLEVLVEDKDALERWGRNGQHIIEVYEPQSSDANMTEARLRQLTEAELAKRVNAIVEYETDIVDLEHVPGLENKVIRFGDTIRIKDTKFNPPLYLEARIHTQDRDIIDKSKKTVTLGDYIEYTEEEVTAIWKSLQEEIRKKISLVQLLEYAEPKKVESDTPPPIKEGENPIWIDTSGEIKTPHVVIDGEWVKTTLDEENALVKGVNYNGLKWDDELGLIVERDDGLVRSILSGTDGIRIQIKNDEWVDAFYVDAEGNVIFTGILEGSEIIGSNFEARYEGEGDTPYGYTNLSGNALTFTQSSDSGTEYGERRRSVMFSDEGISYLFERLGVGFTEAFLRPYEFSYDSTQSGGAGPDVAFRIGISPWEQSPRLKLFSSNGIEFESPVLPVVRAPLSLLNGWENYHDESGEFAQAYYTKNADGMVYLEGVIRDGLSGNYSCGQLPVGCRPRKTEIFNVESNGQIGRVDVTPDGHIWTRRIPASWFSLSSIAFHTDIY